MLIWTTEHFHKKGHRREVTVNLEGKVTSRDCAGISTLCFDKHSRYDHLVFDLTQVDEKDGSIPVLICCLRKTPGLAAGRVSLRGIPSRLQGPTADFMDIPEGAARACHNEHHCPVSRLAYGASPVGPWPVGEP